jgi:hypothetical protein
MSPDSHSNVPKKELRSIERMTTRPNAWPFLPSKSLLAFPLLALLSFAPAKSRAQGPLDPRALVAAACARELESDRSDHTPFMYRDHDITPDHDTLFQIVETPDGNLKRKLEDHGHPLSEQERKADDARIQNLLNDPGLQRKLKKDSAHDDEQAEELLQLLPTAFLWSVAAENGDLITLNFKPDPKFSPANMEASVFADMAGQIVMSKADSRIRSMRGTMVNDVKIGLFGLALVGKLHKGGTFQVEHREVAPHHWQLTELHVHIAGHILFNFKTIGSQEDETKTDFKLSPARTLQQAWEIVNPPPPPRPMISAGKPTRK